MSLLAAVAACGASATLLGNGALPADAVDGARAGHGQAPPGMQRSSERRNENAASAGFSDGFEDYMCPSILVPQGGWEAWDESENACDETRIACFPEPVHSGEHSMAITGNPNLALAEDIIHQFAGIEEGTVWRFSAWVYVPTANTGSSYFILLSHYEHGGGQELNRWATQLEMNCDDNYIESEYNNVQLPLLKDQWVEIVVVIDLIQDQQVITYDGELLEQKGWTEGPNGLWDGDMTLDAVNLWANNAPGWVFYDDITLEELDPVGAACGRDGSCTDGVSPDDCQWPDCHFMGYGTRCEFQECPVDGPEGWELEAPFMWDGGHGSNDTCDQVAENCDEIYEGKDIQFKVTIPWASNWTFDTTGSDPFDTELLIGDTGLCARDFIDDGGCIDEPSVPPCLGDQDAGSGNESIFKLGLGEGDVINVNVETFSGECGTVDLSVEAPCPDLALPAGDAENETCPGPENDGCNMDPGQEAFTPIALGQTYLGKSWLGIDGNESSRDTDWYELVLVEDTTVTLTFKSEFSGRGIAGIIQYQQNEGSGNCADIYDADGNGWINPAAFYDRCSEYPGEGSPAEITADLVAGTWWFFAGPVHFSGIGFGCTEDPGADYWIKVEEGASCVMALDGDVNFDGCTDFSDLLMVLDKWDSPGFEGDGNCDGKVDFGDLLLVLTGWSGEGECQ